MSGLWQIHPFGEGNTRTTAVFLIKYLHKLGFATVNNELFNEHSWYFRNALVRANHEDLSKGIHKTEKYLVRFLSNLLLKETHSLKNREMHVHYTDPVTGNAPINVPINATEKAVFELIKNNTSITYDDIGAIIKRDRKTVQRAINKLKKLGFIERLGSNKTGAWQITKKL